MDTLVIVLIIVSCCISVCLSSLAAGITGYFYKNTVCTWAPWIPVLCSKITSHAGSGGAGASTTTSSTGGGTGTGEWKQAYATYYYSYPPCCPKAPNYDPKAPKDECDDYSGCKYMGQFAGIDGKLSIDAVKVRNIAAFFDDSHQRTETDKQKWWTANVKGKKIEIRNGTTGKPIIVELLDTCGNYDCKGEGKYGCCSQNALKGGGILIDLEYNTAKRFWGAKPRNGKIQWRWAA